MTPDFLQIDGSFGEGGGQILRSSLALSLVTQTPIRIVNIRAGRKKPGLRAQHVACVRAAAKVGQAEVTGAQVRADELTFAPGPIQPGHYTFRVGTAGSTTLVAQAVLPALLSASGPTTFTVEGGTHNPMAPPFDFLARCYLPLINRMGPRVSAELDRPGFVPQGNGRFKVTVEPCAALRPLELLERGRIKRRRAQAVVSHLPAHIAERELKVVGRELGWKARELEVVQETRALSPGNVLLLEVEGEHASELVTGFGQQGVRAEKVAKRAVVELRRYLDAKVPVGQHLADQLLLPLALAGAGRFRTLEPTLHTTTHCALIAMFLPVRFEVTDRGDGVHEVEVGPRPAG